MPVKFDEAPKLSYVPEEKEVELNVLKEIQWGENLRVNKYELKKFDEAFPKQKPIKTDRTTRKKQKSLNLQPIVNDQTIPECEQCYHQQDRRVLTRKEHMNLISSPKNWPCCIHEVCQHEKIKRRKGPKSIPPRYLAISLPKPEKILFTLQRYQYRFTPERITYLTNLMKRSDALTTREAHRYFLHLTNKRRRAKKIERNPKKIAQYKKTKKDVDRIVGKLFDYFYRHPLTQIRHRHVIITDEILNTILSKNSKFYFNRSNPAEYSQILFDFVDQISAWIDQKITEVDLPLDDEIQGTFSITETITDSSVTNSNFMYSDVLEYDRRHKIKDDDEEEEAEKTFEETISKTASFPYSIPTATEMTGRTLYGEEEEEEETIGENSVYDVVTPEYEYDYHDEEEEIGEEEQEGMPSIASRRTPEPIPVNTPDDKEKEEKTPENTDNDTADNEQKDNNQNDEQKGADESNTNQDPSSSDQPQESVEEEKPVVTEIDPTEVVVDPTAINKDVIEEVIDPEASKVQENVTEEVDPTEIVVDPTATQKEEVTDPEVSKDEVVTEVVDPTEVVVDPTATETEVSKEEVVTEVVDPTEVVVPPTAAEMEEVTDPGKDEEKEVTEDVVDPEEIVVQPEEMVEEEEIVEPGVIEEEIVEPEGLIEEEIVEPTEEILDADEFVEPPKSIEVKDPGEDPDKPDREKDCRDGKELEKPSVVREHSPDMICCYSLKIWASWLVEVAHNSKVWCQWITDTIGKIKLFAAILRGEVKNSDGTLRKLHREEWKDFKEQLEQDIVAFKQYNAHVDDLSRKIIEKFSGKQVACCPICLESKLIISVDNGHQVIYQITEAVKTADYWRRWLSKLVAHAENIQQLNIEELPSTSKPVENAITATTPKIKCSTFEIMSITTNSSSSSSRYIIEEYELCNKK